MINANKSKKLTTSFSKKVSTDDIPLFCISVSDTDRMFTTFKLLYVLIISDLSWDCHLTYLL